eukprot:1711540-Rhodomonas_salina.1
MRLFPVYHLVWSTPRHRRAELHNVAQGDFFTFQRRVTLLPSAMFGGGTIALPRVPYAMSVTDIACAGSGGPLARIVANDPENH